MPDALPQKQWTVMVYLAGDNNLDSAGVVDLEEMKQVGSTADVNILAQFDRQAGNRNTKRYYLRKDTSLKQDIVADLGETNTGDPNVLRDFVLWGAATYPAQHLLLVIWNHGAGWDDSDVYHLASATMGFEVTRREGIAAAPSAAPAGQVSTAMVRRVSDGRLRRSLFGTTVEQALFAKGIAYDDNARDFLDSVELKRVLKLLKQTLRRKIDVLGMDACLMNMAEVAYQVREGADFLVGSEEVEPGEGWPYHTILADLATQPTLSPREVSAALVNRYLAAYNARDGVTQSALDLAQSETLRTAVDQLAQALLPSLADPTARAAIVQARTQVQSYAMPAYIDLVDFCNLLSPQFPQSPISAACQAVLTATNTGQFVVASGYKGKPVSHSYGVSIYFPTDQVSSLYRNLDFAKKSVWDSFLRAFIKATARR